MKKLIVLSFVVVFILGLAAPVEVVAEDYQVLPHDQIIQEKVFDPSRYPIDKRTIQEPNDLKENVEEEESAIIIVQQPWEKNSTLTYGQFLILRLEWVAKGISSFDVFYRIGDGDEMEIKSCSNTQNYYCDIDLLSEMVGKDITVIVTPAGEESSKVSAVSDPFNVKGQIAKPTLVFGETTITFDNTKQYVGDVLTVSWTANATAITTYDVYYVINGNQVQIDASPISKERLPIKLTISPEMVGKGVSLIVYDADKTHPETVSQNSFSMDITSIIQITQQPDPIATHDVGDTVIIKWAADGIQFFNVSCSADGATEFPVAACIGTVAAASFCEFQLTDHMVGDNVIFKIWDADPTHLKATVQSDPVNILP